jgi:hypothetical protein
LFVFVQKAKRRSSLHRESGAESVHVDVTVLFELFVEFKRQLGVEASWEIPQRIFQGKLKYEIGKSSLKRD